MAWSFLISYSNYLSSNNTTRFCFLYFRKVFLIVIFKHFLRCVDLVLPCGDSNFTHIITSFLVFCLSFSLYPILTLKFGFHFGSFILLIPFFFFLFFTVPVLPSSPSNFIFILWSLVFFFSFPIFFPPEFHHLPFHLCSLAHHFFPDFLHFCFAISLRRFLEVINP